MSAIATETSLQKVQPSLKLAWILIVTGGIGLFGAVSLTIERIHVWLNPNQTLSCDVNIWISCKSVMLTKQAALFGFPNSFIGVIAFLFPVALGVATLLGYRYSAAIWRVFFAGLGIGMTFVAFLFSQSTFVIVVLCPYCMIVWAGMIPLFTYTALFLIGEGVVGGPKFIVRNIRALQEWDWVIALGVELLALLIIIVRFNALLPTLFAR